MIDFNADIIKDLCNSEKENIFYGFELGKIHSHLKQCHLEMTETIKMIKLKNQAEAPIQLKCTL